MRMVEKVAGTFLPLMDLCRKNRLRVELLLEGRGLGKKVYVDDLLGLIE